MRTSIYFQQSASINHKAENELRKVWGPSRYVIRNLNLSRPDAWTENLWRSAYQHVADFRKDIQRGLGRGERRRRPGEAACAKQGASGRMQRPAELVPTPTDPLMVRYAA